MSLQQPKVGFVSLGCPKALVDSERILTQLRVEGYSLVPTYDDADVVVVNTCGFIDSAVAESLDAIGEAMVAAGPIPIEARGLGWFPNPHSPRVLFAGIQAPESLTQLHRRSDEAVAVLGVPTETRPFRPHLTLARIENKIDVADLRHAIFQMPSNQFGAFTAEEFHLYESRMEPGGSVYTKRATFSL